MTDFSDLFLHSIIFHLILLRIFTGLCILRSQLLLRGDGCIDVALVYNEFLSFSVTRTVFNVLWLSLC